MIAEVSGTLTNAAGDLVTIMTAGGVAYDVSIPLPMVERMPPVGSAYRVHTALIVRDDGWQLFGFDHLRDRTVFHKLLQASGVGPRLALNILSALGGERIVHAVRTSDIGLLCTVPGIGKKKAERMILELKDRLSDLHVSTVSATPPVGADAITALVNLGYPLQDADAAVRQAITSTGVSQTADIIRAALQLLTRPK